MTCGRNGTCLIRQKASGVHLYYQIHSAMAFLKVFKVPKNQKFQYRPRHWDPQKEELENRLRQAEERRRSDASGAKARIASEMRRQKGGGDKRFRQQQVFRSNLLLFGIIAFLLLAAYVFLQIYMPEIIKAIQ